MVSLPEPVVIVFAKAEPVTTTAVVKALASRFSKLVTLTVSPVVWSEPDATAKLTALEAGAGGDDQRVGAGVAVDRHFRAAILNRVVACPGIDDVGAATAIDRVVS